MPGASWQGPCGMYVRAPVSNFAILDFPDRFIDCLRAPVGQCCCGAVVNYKTDTSLSKYRIVTLEITNCQKAGRNISPEISLPSDKG